MIKIRIPASKAINGENAAYRIVTAPPLVCATAKTVLNELMPINSVTKATHSLIFIDPPPGGYNNIAT